MKFLTPLHCNYKICIYTGVDIFVFVRQVVFQFHVTVVFGRDCSIQNIEHLSCQVIMIVLIISKARLVQWAARSVEAADGINR